LTLEKRTLPQRGTLFSRVGDQLRSLVEPFGLQAQRNLVLSAYDLACGEALAIPTEGSSAGYSKINPDGTPFQHSLVLGASKQSLQFLTEVASPRGPEEDGARLCKDRVRSLGRLLGIDAESPGSQALVDLLVPDGDPRNLADGASPLWAGVGFSRDSGPRLTVYANAGDGGWKLVDEFVARVGGAPLLHRSRWHLEGKMDPLGAAVSFRRDSGPSGRVYLRAFGNALPYYRRLAHATGDGHYMDRFGKFIGTMVGEGARFPLPSVVCSYGVGPGAEGEFKLELCTHCLMESDYTVAMKLLYWLRLAGVESEGYQRAIDMIAGSQPSKTAVRMHGYVGLGSRNGGTYTSVYLNPGWEAPAEDEAERGR
jgi:hypothetical protein